MHHLILTFGAQMSDETDLRGVVESIELCFGVRFDVGRIDVVLDIEFGRYPLMRVREFGGVKDHARTRWRASGA